MPIRREKTKQQTEMVTSSGFEASPYVLNYIVIVHSFLRLTVTVTLKITSWCWSKQFIQSSRCWRLRRWSPRCAVREQEKNRKKSCICKLYLAEWLPPVDVSFSFYLSISERKKSTKYNNSNCTCSAFDWSVHLPMGEAIFWDWSEDLLPQDFLPDNEKFHAFFSIDHEQSLPLS